MVQDAEEYCLDRVEELNHRRAMLIGRSKADGDKTNPSNADTMQVIIEMLLSSTKTTSIGINVVSFKNMYQEYLDVQINELHTVDFIRKLKGNIRITWECLASCVIAKSDRRRKLHYDGTTRRQAALTSLITNVIQYEKITPVFMSYSHITIGESPEQIVDATLDMLEAGKSC